MMTNTVNSRNAGAPSEPEPDPSQRMLSGAIEAFAERGFHATKAALLARISLVGHQTAWDLVQRAAMEEGDPVERLRTLVSRFVAWHAENHRTARVVQYELHALPDEARRAVVTLRRHIEYAVEDLIRAGVDAKMMDVDQPRRVARAILSLSIDVARWYDPAGRDTAAELGALYAELAARMVCARPHPARGSLVKAADERD
jgi:AcrR family transcriptional regulator